MKSSTFISTQIKVTIFLIIFFLTPTLFSVFKVEATPQTVVKVDPPIIFAHLSERFSVNITVSNVQNLYGVEIDLYWTPSILEMVNADIRLGVEHHPDGVLYEPVIILQNQTFQQQGKYVLAGLSASEPPSPPSFNGSGNIVTITFNVTGVGRCELSLETKLASNIIPAGSTTVAPIAHTTLGGFFGPIQIIAAPNSVTVDENVNISGFIYLAQANIPVTILYRGTENAEWQQLKIVNTTEQGSYTYVWNPKKSGTYYMKTTATILGHIEESPIVLINVKEREQFNWLYIIIGLALIILIIPTVFILYRKRTRKRQKKP